MYYAASGTKAALHSGFFYFLLVNENVSLISTIFLYIYKLNYKG